VNGGSLTNIDNTISGDFSVFEPNTLTNDHGGVINSSNTGDFSYSEIDALTITNFGLIESTGPKPFWLVVVYTLDNAGGTISAANGSVVDLISAENSSFKDSAPATLVGGSFNSLGTGVISVAANAGNGRGFFIFDGTTSPISNLGHLTVAGDVMLTVDGTIDNTGSITLEAGNDYTLVEIGGSNATLTGTGAVILGGGKFNLLTAATAGDTLTNVGNTISGIGVIGIDGGQGSALAIVNEAAGVIDADDSAGLLLNTDAQTVTNAGLIEGTGTGGLTVEDTPIDNAGGTILAANGSKVLLDGSDIAGGTLVSKGTGALKTIGGTNVLDGTSSAVTLTGVLALGDGTALTIQGGIDNGKDLELSSTGDATTLTIGAVGATLSGSGQLSLSNKTENEITGASSAATLTNVANTISGAGQLGGGALTLVNEAKGVIEGQFTTGLVIDTGSNTLTNAGIIEAVDGGSVSLKSAIDNSGTLIVTRGTLGLQGAVDNTGQIDVRGGTAATLSIAVSGVTLTGGGDLALDNADNQVTGASSTATLTNVANTISGAGTISAVLINEAGGVVEGQFTTGLVINAGSNTETNAGLIEAIDGGSVSVESALANTGTVLVTNGTLTLAGAVTGAGVAQIKGGVLDAAAAFDESVAFTGGTGVLELADSQGYTSGQISGFSKSGGTSFDLQDITFTSGVTTATFSGTSTSGVLTVTNGTQTAEINLTGDYLASTFTTNADTDGGTIVTDPTGPTAVQRFVEAAARMAPAAVAIATPAGEARDAFAPILARPGAALA